MMFRKQEIIFTGLLIILTASVFFCFFRTTSDDSVAYEKIMALVDSPKASTQKPSYETRQQRVGVGKDFFYVKGSDRLHLRLRSESSELDVDYNEGQMEVVEHFHKVRCLMQESLLAGSSSEQIIRVVDAENATYRYQTGQLVADDVKIARYRMPGHQLSNEFSRGFLLMKGDADFVTFSLGGKDVNLHAKTLNASFLHPEKMDVESANADYSDEKVVLTGNVIAKHSLGNLYAKKMTMASPILLLDGDVLIELSEGGQLSCGKADINYERLNGSFFGSDPHGEVIYTDGQLYSDLPKKNSKAPLTSFNMRSRQMQMELIAQNEKSLVKYSMGKINAEGSVEVNYNNDFTSFSDQAQYQRSLDKTSSSSAAVSRLKGFITLKMNDPHDLCTVNHRNGDKIQSQDIQIDTLKRNLAFTKAKGVIISRSDKADDSIEFVANRLLWESTPQLLTLSGDVMIDQSGIGRLHTDYDVKIKQQIVNGKKEVKTIACSQDTVLSYLTAQDKGSHTLTCYGALLADHEQMKTVMESPFESDGKVPEGMQVHFEDSFGEILADKATIDYSRVDNKIDLAKITLEGNVKLYNKKVKGDNPSQQYALADTVTYFPQTSETILSSNKKNRVLFFDEVNHIQVSAPALKIQRDKETNKDTFQGMGDVRFNFIENEYEQLKQLFNLKK